jgi:hypothetical protein
LAAKELEKETQLPPPITLDATELVGSSPSDQHISPIVLILQETPVILDELEVDMENE